MSGELRAEVSGETAELEIRISVDTLMWAANRWSMEEEFQRTEGKSNRPSFVINDEYEWARDVVKALMREDEAGETLLTRMFDKAFAAVLQRGTCATTDVEPEEHRP